MLVKYFQRKSSLKVKLSILVTFAVIVVVAALGFYFDNFLKKSFLENTQVRFQHGYERLAYNLDVIENELKEGVDFVRSDEKLIAAIELVNNYQDKDNYNTYLIDEEKKFLANQLLSRVKLSFNDDIALYDRNQELIAYVTKEKDGYLLNYISFKNGGTTLFSRYEHQNNFQPIKFFKIPENIMYIHRNIYNVHDVKQMTLLTYHQLQDRLSIKSHKNIVEANSEKVVGHIEMSKIIGIPYFTELSQALDLQVSYSFHNSGEKNIRSLHEGVDAQKIQIVQTSQTYDAALKHKIQDGFVYFLASLDKRNLNTLLNQNRFELFLLLIFVTISILVLMRAVINRGLDQPLSVLMQQIHRIENQDYSSTPPLVTGDELEMISRNINQLAETVNEREESLKISRNELEYLSNHDMLTDLPNRRFFMNRLQHALDLASRTDMHLAIFFIDLDQFKLVNDTLGHDVGDELLVQVTRRLQRNVRAGDTLARIGGDEIYILIENAPSQSVLEAIVQKYLQTFHQAFHCFGHEITISASIGISIYPENGEDSISLIKHADLAMYSSKDHGRNRYTFFSDELSQYASERANLIHDLERAVESPDQFELYYQPKVTTDTHEVVSIEALIRWNRPGYGLIQPTDFIYTAEEIGLINPIGEWALKKACSDFIELQKEGVTLKQVSVNVSSVQMKKSDMLSQVKQTLAETGIKSQQLELEITESYIATDVDRAIEILRTFNKMGVGVAIDDFGTGYSSMNYLQKLPITRLKIDKSFVDGLPKAKDSITITRAIISLAKSFNLAITAEGVENREQLQFLQKEHCDEIQGNLFSKPLTKDELVLYYHRHQVKSSKKGVTNVLTFADYPRDDD